MHVSSAQRKLPPSFHLASPCPSIVHHLSGLNRSVQKLHYSLKFSKENPEIKITSQIVTGDKIKLVLLTFADNGIGFDSQFKEQIFQLFQRLHGKQEYAGTGIGLSIVKKIVEQHKGFVTADSVGGKGATFKVWLPVGE